MEDINPLYKVTSSFNNTSSCKGHIIENSKTSWRKLATDISSSLRITLGVNDFSVFLRLLPHIDRYIIGHIKAACPLICKIVRRKKIHVTFIVSLPFYERLKAEVDNRFEPGLEDDLRATIR